jgi:CRP/FNR family transcriptional regulator, cyclic AMP receptor protein
MRRSNALVHERLFDGLTPAVRALALRGIVRSYRKNTVLMNEGESGDTTYVLLAGRVKLYSNDACGREIVYDIVEPGDYFAELSFDGGPRTVSAMTLEAAVCSVVEAAQVRAHLSHPPYADEFMAHVMRRARAATLTARELALKDVYGRVVTTLEGQRGPASAGAPITLAPLTHQTIASRVGASREMVSRLLKDLERGGYVALGVRQITLMRKLPARW